MYVDNTGRFHADYTAACEYYGADTPAMIEAEMAAVAYEEYDANMDAMEARGGPAIGLFVPMDRWDELTEDVPF